MLLLSVLCIIFLSIILFLLLKIHDMHKSALEIKKQFQMKLECDTNTLISISSRDKVMTSLALSINKQLKELRRLRHRYVQGDRELKETITNISHDLRTPLTAISGYLDLLKDCEMSEEASRYMPIIQERVEMLTTLTQELFTYSMISLSNHELTISPVNMNRIIEDSVAAFYVPLTNKGIYPDIRLPQEPVIRNLNEEALYRILSNLLHNAMKYSEKDLSIILTEEGCITIENTAKGLNGMEVDKLFDRFYTLETGRKSSGIGLSIVKALVEEMNGEIQASYESEKLSIRVCFPNTHSPHTPLA